VNASAEPASTGLTRRQFWGVLLAALALFAFAAGPVWRNPWDIDASVFLSYAAIPPLVLAVLLASRRFTWRDFVLDTLTVTLAKFGVTYVAAAALWAISGQPPPLTPAPPRRFPPAPAETPHLVPPPEAASLEGVVTAGGAPRAGAVVWVARGLEGYAHPQRTTMVEIVDDGSGFVPPVAAVQVRQPLNLRSGDGRLHAIRGSDARGRTVFNVAVPVAATLVHLEEPAGVVKLDCAVHEHAGQERAGWLVVVAHPFFATTGADGRFRFEALPRGKIVVRALDAELGETEQAVELPSSSSVTLPLARAPAPAPR
jgi:hypothetical protein